MTTELPPELEKIRDEYEAKIAKLAAQNEKLIAALEFCGQPIEDGPKMYIFRQIEDAQKISRQALREVRGEE